MLWPCIWWTSLNLWTETFQWPFSKSWPRTEKSTWKRCQTKWKLFLLQSLQHLCSPCLSLVLAGDSALLEGICLPYSGIIRQADVFLLCGTEVFKRPESWICARKAAADSWGLNVVSLPFSRCSLCPLFLKQWFWKAPPGEIPFSIRQFLFRQMLWSWGLFPLHSTGFSLVILTQGLKWHTLDILRALLSSQNKVIW